MTYFLIITIVVVLAALDVQPANDLVPTTVVK